MNKISWIIRYAAFGLALIFAFSCSGSDNGGNDNGGGNGGSTEQSYSYCIMADKTCLVGPFTVSACNGQVSNSCPNGSSPSAGGSSSYPSGLSSSAGNGSSIEYGSMADNDGKTYRTIKINEQVWMVENLSYNASGSKCYGENGQEIVSHDIETGYTYTTLSLAEIQANCDKYGRLYDWETAKKICPKDWHLPSNAEWDALITTIGGKETAGRYLKATSGWNDNGNGTNAYGFSALPGGSGYSDGNFRNAGNGGWWWSSSEYSSNSADYLRMSYDIDGVSYGDYYKNSLYSVRCLKD